jgi:hypothetical protein
MLDDTVSDEGSSRPTWDDIETILLQQIKSYTESCNGPAIHGERYFESTPQDIQHIGALAGNLCMMNQIAGIITELQTRDPDDPSFHQFIKRLRLRSRNYERTH